MGAGRKAVITAGDPVGVWAAWKHRMGYTWEEIGEALHMTDQGILYRVMKSGAPTKRPRLKKPKRLRGEGPSREWAWECLLEGYTKTEIAVALDVSREWIEWLLKDRRKVMPPLVTTWIGGEYMEKSELIKALRSCSRDESCAECPMYGKQECMAKLMEAAAKALEGKDD